MSFSKYERLSFQLFGDLNGGTDTDLINCTVPFPRVNLSVRDQDNAKVDAGGPTTKDDLTKGPLDSRCLICYAVVARQEETLGAQDKLDIGTVKDFFNILLKTSALDDDGLDETQEKVKINCLEELTSTLSPLNAEFEIPLWCRLCGMAVKKLMESVTFFIKLKEQIFQLRHKVIEAIKLSTKFAGTETNLIESVPRSTRKLKGSLRFKKNAIDELRKLIVESSRNQKCRAKDVSNFQDKSCIQNDYDAEDGKASVEIQPGGHDVSMEVKMESFLPFNNPDNQSLDDLPPDLDLDIGDDEEETITTTEAKEDIDWSPGEISHSENEAEKVSDTSSCRRMSVRNKIRSKNVSMWSKKKVEKARQRIPRLTRVPELGSSSSNRASTKSQLDQTNLGKEVLNGVEYWQVYDPARRLRKWRCGKCKRKCSTLDAIKRHIHIRHIIELTPENSFACSTCGKRFFFNWQRLRHERRFCKKHKCSSCDAIFNKYVLLKRHERSAHSSNDNICPFCGKTFEGKHATSSLNHHIAALHNPNTAEISCAFCSAAFRVRFKWKRHMFKKHPEHCSRAVLEIYTKQMVKKAQSAMIKRESDDGDIHSEIGCLGSELKREEKSAAYSKKEAVTHESETGTFNEVPTSSSEAKVGEPEGVITKAYYLKKYKSAGFGTIDSDLLAARERLLKLQKVQNVSTEDGLPSRGAVGGQGLKNWDGGPYYRGIEIIKDDTGYLCGLCVAEERPEFAPHKKAYSIVQHINRIHSDLSKAHKCSDCGKAFYYYHELTVHRTYHHEAPPEYLCHICGKRFTRPGNRYEHIKSVHKGIKTNKCEFEGCDKVFATKKDLTIHMRRHTGERPFICHICADAFIDKQTMKRHVRIKHPEVTEEELKKI